MNAYFLHCTCVLISFLMVSCSNYNEDPIKKLEYIKKVGDKNPKQALAMLDSLEIEIRNESEYAKHKYDLLRIRLNDKADNIPISDIMIKQLIVYFEEKGSVAEKQEVYYYAGSTYRDLQDSPRAIEFFLKSLEYAIYHKGCDPIMLRNTYSNLNYIYYLVQDYTNAQKMAINELEACKSTNSDVVLPFLHIGGTYHALDSVRQAEIAFDSAYTKIIHSKNISKYQESLAYLLYEFSDLGNIQKAKACFTLIDENSLNDFSAPWCMDFAKYYILLGKNDSVAFYCERILDDGTDTKNMYDAAKLLFRMYYKMKDNQNACKYAYKYMQLSDSLDFGKRQELAATVNNQFKYHLDQKKEQKLKNEKEKYKNTLVVVALTSLLLASVGYILYIKRRNKHLQVITTLSSELQQVIDKEKYLSKTIREKENELTKARKSFKKTTDELNNVKQELDRVNEELTEYNEALKEKEKQLAERMEQNKSFIKLLHQSELEGKAEDVIHAIRKSSTGRMNMESADWKQLFKAVDELYPTFNERLLKELGNFTDQQKQVCYLMRIGLSKPQIQNMTNLARVTIWRWVKKYDWVFTSED